MTKQQPVAASILALATSLAQGSGLEGTFHSQWQSRYVTEGRDNLDSNPLVTAGVDLTHRDVTAGVWQGWANGSDYRENNLFVEYAPYVERWSPYLNVTYLQFHPQGPDDVETGAGFSAPIQPWLSLSLDGTWSKQASGAFYALTVHSQRELAPGWTASCISPRPMMMAMPVKTITAPTTGKRGYNCAGRYCRLWTCTRAGNIAGPEKTCAVTVATT